jgi:hypothetical protein
MRSLKRMLAAMVIGYSLSFAAQADDCVQPAPPSKIPEGKTASEQEMGLARQTMADYAHDIDTYVKCLEFAAAHNGLSSREATDLGNRAIDVARKITGQFNDQLKVFKAKTG